MIIEETDRVGTIVFTLPVDSRIWPSSTGPTPSDKADVVADLFDDYLTEVQGDLNLRRFEMPRKLPSGPGEWKKLGLVHREGWELWQCTVANLIVEDGS